MLLHGLLWNTSFSLIFYRLKIFLTKKAKKSVEEIKKELLESTVNERLEDLELNNKADN